jgi:CobQ-like glutamine amidotransferase family enzyme
MTIEILYPELCNLYGDPMNIEYLLRALPDATVYRTRFTSRPRFADEHVDMLYLCSMTEQGQSLAAAALMPHVERLNALIDDGVVVLATGNALELFGRYIDDDGGDARVTTLGLFDTHAVRHMMNRYNSLYWGAFGDRQIVGFKSQFSHTYGDGGDGLFTTTRGAGRNPDVIPEGFHRNNLMATYVLGPLLILNPPFTRYLLKTLGAGDAALPFEKAAMDVYELRLREFSDPKRGFSY